MLKYLYAIEPNNQRGNGVEKKITGQVKALINNGIVTTKEGCNKLPKWKRIIPFASSSIDWTKIDLEGVTSLYIRYDLCDYQFIKFLKRAKALKIKICIEIPTYPYINELKQRSFILRIRDSLYSTRLKNYVDRIYYMGGNEEVSEIYGIKCEKICNGIDFASIKLRNANSIANNIRLITVADFQKGHGYERILKGMSYYLKTNGKRRLDFYLVGDGDEKTYYERLSCELNLEKYVHFIGAQKGKKLDELYDNADIGVEVFGLYKRGIKCSSSLKSREYLARGLPFICGAPNDVIDTTCPFCKFFKNNDSIIDMEEVIKFNDSVYKDGVDRNEISFNIRKFGMNIVNWEKTMLPVSNFIKE